MLHAGGYVIAPRAGRACVDTQRRRWQLSGDVDCGIGARGGNRSWLQGHVQWILRKRVRRIWLWLWFPVVAGANHITTASPLVEKGFDGIGQEMVAGDAAKSSLEFAEIVDRRGNSDRPLGGEPDESGGRCANPFQR